MGQISGPCASSMSIGPTGGRAGQNVYNEQTARAHFRPLANLVLAPQRKPPTNVYL